MTALTPELLAAMTLFAFVSSITPGPNNTMLMASGANFGFRASIPHLLGVSGGFFILVVAVGLGLEDRHLQGNGDQRWFGQAADLPAGCGLPVGEPQGLGDGARRGDRLCAA